MGIPVSRYSRGNGNGHGVVREWQWEWEFPCPVIHAEMGTDTV